MLSTQDQQAKSVMTKSSLFTVLSNLIDTDYQQGSTYSGEPVSITLMDSNDNVNGDINLATLINPDDELQLVVRFVNTDIDEAHSWVESLLNQIGLENNCEIIDEGDDTDNTITAIFILDDFSDVNNIEVQETDVENDINTLDLVTDIDKINEAENILQNIVTTNNINFNSDGVIETNNTNFNDNTDNDDNSSNDNSNDDNSCNDDNNCNDDEKINTEEISTEEKISINNEINDTNEQLQKNINSEQINFNQINFDQSLSEQNQLSQIDSEEDNLQNEILQSDSNMNNVEMNNIEEQDNNEDNDEDVEKQNSNEEQNNDEDEDESIEINEELRKAMSSINPNINMYYSIPTKNEIANNTSAKTVVANLETKDNINTNDDNSGINDNNVEVEIIDTDNNIKEEVNNENIIIASNKKIIIANNNNSVIPTTIPAIPSASSASINSAVVVSTQVQTKTKAKTKSTRKSKTANQQQVNLNNVTTSTTSATPTVMGMSIKGLSNRVSATTADGRILSAAGQVKEMLDEITANNTMTTALLANLQDVAICKDKMKLSYPLLMKVNPNMAYKDQALFNGKKRYGKCIITYCSEDFYVTNHIFATNVPKIRSYLESLNLIKKSTHSVTVTNPAILKQQAIQNLINQKTGITSVTPLATPTDITASTLQQVNSSTSTSTDIQSQSQS